MVSLLAMLQRLKREIKEGKTFLQFSFLKAFGNGLGMVLPLIVVGIFSEELVTSYWLAKLVVIFFSTLIMNALLAPFVVFANQEKVQTNKINKTFSIQCMLLLITLSLGCVVAVLLANSIAAFAKISIRNVPFLLFGFMGITIKMFICNLYMGLDERIKNATSEVIFGTSCIVLVLVFYLTGTLSLRSVFAVYPISALLLIAIFFKTTDLSPLLPLQLDKKLFAEIITFAKWQFIGASSVFFINWAATPIMRYYNMSTDINVFNLGFSFFKGLIMLMTVVSAYFLPFVSANINEPEKIENYLYRKRPRVIAAGVMVLIVFFFAAPAFLDLLYPGKYIGSGLTIRLLLVAAAFALYGLFYMPLFNALKMYRYLQTISIAQVVLSTVLNLVLIPYYGYKGAAIATILGYVLRISSLEICFRQVARRKLGI
jgi:O-antigen/teichoic acid export membrane protein